MNENITFCRRALELTHMDVRKFDPSIKVSDAAVHKSGNTWEFTFYHVTEDSSGKAHADRFYWHGRADNAYDARVKGWDAFLAKKTRVEEVAQ